MSVIVLAGGNISSGTLPGTEGVIASVQAEPTATRVRVRGHVLMTCNGVAGNVTLRVRQASLTGTQIYTATMTHTASEQKNVPFEVDDTTNFGTQANPATNGLYVLTAVDSGGGTIQGGSIYLETVP